MKIEKAVFGEIDNNNVLLFTLTNSNGVTIKLTNYGGIVTSIVTPDKNGKYKNIVLGFDKLEDYLSDEYLRSYPYFGCIIGRNGNRICNSQFEIDGKTYMVTPNVGKNHLHGGKIGFDRVVWNSKSFNNTAEVGVELTYTSVDGEEGYPGNLQVKVVYSLTNQNEFKIEYSAETDKATPVNLTQHTYFNLGEEKDIKNHHLQINSLEITETDVDSIPTGKMLPVYNSPFDFNTKKKIGRDFNLLELGYDNNFGLANENGNFIKAGELSEEVSGRVVEVFTTEVGMQLYTGAYIPDFEIDGVKKFGQYSGVALETQHYPDAINQKNFASTILRPSKKYNQKTVYKFSVQ